MMRQKENPRGQPEVLMDGAEQRGRTLRASFDNFSTPARGVNCESPAKRILSPMLFTARRNGWVTITGAVVNLWSKWLLGESE